MLTRTHAVIGVLAAMALESYVPHFDPTSYYVLVLIGALLPDIDHEDSTINKILPITKYAGKMFKHRGFFHSIFAPALFYIIIGALSSLQSAFAITIGYLSHLISDAFTKAGITVFYPISKFKISGFIRTDSWQETAIFYGIILVIIFWFI